MIKSLTRCSLAIVVAAALGACNHGDTRIHVTVTADPTWNVDHYELQIGEQSALSEALPALDVEVPDDMAGQMSTFAIWGLTGGEQVAYGMTAVTPALHTTVDVTIALSAVSCGPLCTSGDVECMEDGIATCAAQANGCLGWSVAPCPSDMAFCANGTCAAQCTDECAMGETECDSAVTMRTCGPSTASTCLVWSAPVACPNGQTCTGQACGVAPVCATDGASCDDGNACTQGDSCEGGVCTGTPISCTTPPAPTCSNATTLRSYSTPGTCSAGGCKYTTTETACPNGCKSGACEPAPVCSTNGTSCDDGNPCTQNDTCEGGTCAGTEIACTTPPPPICADARTLRRYSASGTCSTGTCEYGATDSTCADGCLNGACSSVCIVACPEPVTVSTGYDSTCGVKSDGTIACWGNTTETLAGSFTSVSVGGDGDFFACGLKTDSTLACWGGAYDGDTTPPAGTFASLSSNAGESFSCAVRSDGTVACWGDNQYGQSSPPAGTFASLSAGLGFVCGVKIDGTVACWGDNSVGESTAPAGTFTSVSGGNGFACGVKTGGTLACWGYNTDGESTPPAGTFSSVSAGEYFACAVKTSGAVVCWGKDTGGNTTPPAGTFASVSANFYACGVKTNGTVACWGTNTAGDTTPPTGTFEVP